MGFSHGTSGKEYACLCRRHKRCKFDSWVGKIPCSRKWYPTLTFLPRKFHGQRSLVAYGPWGHKESDMTERLSACQLYINKCKRKAFFQIHYALQIYLNGEFNRDI